MTVSSQTNKVIYIGNGIAKEFAIPFPFLEKEHLKVYQLLTNVRTDRKDWTIDGGNLVFADAPESGAEIAIVREVPLTQETDYRDNEILHAETLERDFDKLTMQVQQLAEKSERAVTVDIFDDTAADSLIPGIRKAVSDCQKAVETTAENARTATACADAATDSATNAAASETNTAAMLGTKADADGSNIVLCEAARRYFTGLNMPDLSAGTTHEFGETVTADEDGFIEIACCAYYNVQGEFSLNGRTVRLCQSNNNSYSTVGWAFFPVPAGTVVKGVSTLSGSPAHIKFYPCKKGA